MRNGFFASLATLLTSAGIAMAQSGQPPVKTGAGEPGASLPVATTAQAAQPPAKKGPGQAGTDVPVTTTPPVLTSPSVIVEEGRGENNRLWLTAEYLLWWTKSSHLPPLVTTGSANPLPGAVTTELFGGRQDQEERSGGRFGLGYWLDNDQTIGVETSFFFIGRRSSGFNATSDGNPLLAIPFLDSATGQESSLIVASPPQTTTTPTKIVIAPILFFFPGATLPGFTTTTSSAKGSVSSALSSRLWGAEANLAWNLGRGEGYRFTALGGFRYLQLQEDLRLVMNSTQTDSGTAFVTIPSDAIPGIETPDGTFPYAKFNSTTTVSRVDEFRTRNQFYGGQIGGRLELIFDRLSVDLVGKCALGNMNERVDISGSNSVNFAGKSTIFDRPYKSSQFTQQGAGGIFAQPSNIGQYSRNVFAVVPEGTFTLGYRLTDRLKATVGYSFLYASAVARPGDQIDRGQNGAQILNPKSSFVSTSVLGGAIVAPLPVLPGAGAAATNGSAFQFRDSSYWAQGINFGIDFRY